MEQRRKKGGEGSTKTNFKSIMGLGNVNKNVTFSLEVNMVHAYNLALTMARQKN